MQCSSPHRAAERRNLKPDPELLYVGAMFHDLGLTDAYATEHRRFEIDGAVQAAQFLAARGVTPSSIRTVWLAVALHTTPGIPEFRNSWNPKLNW